jgi:uncharacterized protein YjbI with pentapeptide repeats
LHGFGGALHLGHLRASEQLDIVKISLSVVAGVGGVIALTVAYRKQQLGEAAHGREEVKLFTERFGACVAQLGDDNPAVRLGGAYALAHLADDWETGRQTCIDVLCAQLRMPYPADQPDDQAAHAAFLSQREVRHTIWRLIGDHLRPSIAKQSWSGYQFDFTSAAIDGADLHGALLDGGLLDFTSATIASGMVNFADAQFRAGIVRFDSSRFAGGAISFSGASFSGSSITFRRCELTKSYVYFLEAKFIAGHIAFEDTTLGDAPLDFSYAELRGSRVSIARCLLADGHISFYEARLLDGVIDFGGSKLKNGAILFLSSEFRGATVSFRRVLFAGSPVNFSDAALLDGRINFAEATFSAGRVSFSGKNAKGHNRGAIIAGSVIDFRSSKFSGGIVDISSPQICTVSPLFDKWTTPPEGLLLPDQGITNAVE